MVDLTKTRAEVERHKQELVDRLKQIPQEIKKLTDEVEQAKRQLIGIDQILEGFSLMENENISPFETYGLTDSIRQVLSETNIHLVPTQIRDALLQKGVMASSSKVLLINVHKTLERIEDELETTTTPEGKTAYKRREPWSPYTVTMPAYGQSFVNAYTTLAALNGLDKPAANAEKKTPSLPIRKRRFAHARHTGTTTVSAELQATMDAIKKDRFGGK